LFHLVGKRLFINTVERLFLQIAVLGEAPFTLETGVKETVNWYANGSERIVAPVLKDVRGTAGMTS